MSLYPYYFSERSKFPDAAIQDGKEFRLLRGAIVLIAGLFLLLFGLAIDGSLAYAQLTEEWVARYDNGYQDDGRCLVLDGSGNVYVTGVSSNGSNDDIATVKYNSTGTQLWVRRYNYGNGDSPGCPAADASGNVYVPGSSSNGSNFDIVTLKYDTNGNLLWSKRYNNGYDDDRGGVTVDASGNVYVAGSSSNGSDNDIVTLKYNSSGTLLWTKRYNNGYEESRGKIPVVDASGNVYVTGGSSNGSNEDIVTLKYNSSGSLLWSKRYDYGGWDSPGWALAVDTSGNVYVAGQSSNDFVTLKYNSSGTLMWDSRYDYGGWDEIYNLALDASGNVYVSGNSSNGFNDDITTVKYDTNGTQLWVQRYDNGDSDWNGRSAVDTNGNVYVMGSSSNGINYDIVTLMYDTNGSQMGLARYDNGGWDDGGFRVAVDTSGNVYVAGSSDNLSNTDFVTVKYTTAEAVGLISSAPGNQQTQTVAWNDMDNEYLVLWQDFRNGTANPDIYGARLDQNGNVVAGDLPIITQTAKQAGPSVAYGGGGYLAVWIDQRTSGTTGTDVYGAWILSDGTVSSEFVVTNALANQRAASVVYNPSANNFLVTWIDDTNGTSDLNIGGAVVNPGGGVSSGPFAMVTATGNQRGPYVRYDYGNSQYFMVWFDNRSGDNDVYGSRVDSSGVLLDGSSLVISNATGNQNNPRITDRRPSDGISNFVLSWIDFRNGQADIYGAIVDGSGVKIGSDIQIAGGSYDQRAASIDVDYIMSGQAVVSWIDDRNGTDFDIYRAQVDQSGVVSGETLVVGAATGAANNQQGPLVAYSEDNGMDNGFLILWRDYRNGVDYDLYGIKVWP